MNRFGKFWSFHYHNRKQSVMILDKNFRKIALKKLYEKL